MKLTYETLDRASVSSSDVECLSRKTVLAVYTMMPNPMLDSTSIVEMLILDMARLIVSWKFCCPDMALLPTSKAAA